MLFDEKGVFTPLIHSGIIETDRKKAKNYLLTWKKSGTRIKKAYNHSCFTLPIKELTL